MIDTSKTYTSKNYGKFKIIDYVSCMNVTVEFIDTGYKTITAAGSIIKGLVKDKFATSVCGVGFLGEGDHIPSVNKKVTKQYLTWKNMLERCYVEKCQLRRPTYRGCSVHEDWHNFQSFAEWYDENYVEGYELDKDIKIDGNKIYGPNTCMYVSRSDNMIKARAKSVRLIGPNGDVVEIYNVAQFANDNNLDQSHLNAVSLGVRKSHKGWAKA